MAVVMTGDLVKVLEGRPRTLRDGSVKSPGLVKVLDGGAGVVFTVEYWDLAQAHAAVGDAGKGDEVELLVSARGFKDSVYWRGISTRGEVAE